ncbi:MAG: ComEC/Rec2 family competence protein [Patescibacteria group bacterium]
MVTKSKIFLFCLLGFILGVFLANFFSVRIFLIISVCIFPFFIIKKRFFLILLFLIVGFFRFQMSLPDFSDQNNIYHYENQKAVFQGRIVNIDERLDKQKLTVRTEKIKLEEWQEASGLILTSTSLFPQYDYGDAVEISCFLKKPEKIEDFDYNRYLARYRIYVICSFPKIKEIDSKRKIQDQFFFYLFSFRRKMSDGLNRAISEPEVSVLQAMLLNQSKGVPDEINQQFSKLGITHIVAISGSHITLVASILMILAVSFGLIRQKAFWLVSVIIVLYVLLVGAPASAVRSAVMGIVMLYAQKIGRLKQMGNVLALAAATMIFANPQILMADVGFQLSFMAVIGLVYIQPKLKKFFSWCPEFLHLKEIFLTTLAAQLTTWPLTLFYFRRFSFVSFLANLMILPVIPFLMTWGIANAFVGLFCAPLARVLGWVSWLLLAYWLKSAELLSLIPWGQISY